ncbi:IS3 family transposase [Micromonospora carbonacea]|uniref:IS3 family transposase n=1 Tax=Micromonospora carbonacea TaxID=47853 RepID=UPI00332B51A7
MRTDRLRRFRSDPRDAAVNRTDVYRFIDLGKTTCPVRLHCRLLGVGHSAFYDRLRQGPRRAHERERHDRQRVEITQQAWSEHRGVHGARRLTAELHECGHPWNRKAVARLMRLAGIEGAHRRRGGKGRRKAASTDDRAGPGPGPRNGHRNGICHRWDRDRIVADSGVQTAPRVGVSFPRFDGAVVTCCRSVQG